MILGIGVDIVSCDRFHGLADKAEFLAQILTPAELGRAPRGEPDRYFATVLAAKEAVLKALGCGLAQGWLWHQVEISGDHTVHLSGRLAELLEEQGGGRCHVASARDRGHAVAWAIIE
jgi:holo-[acyl-carrier protein] synthase